MSNKWSPIYNVVEEERHYNNHMVARKRYLDALEKHRAGLLTESELNNILGEENTAFSDYMRFRAL